MANAVFLSFRIKYLFFEPDYTMNDDCQISNFLQLFKRSVEIAFRGVVFVLITSGGGVFTRIVMVPN